MSTPMSKVITIQKEPIRLSQFLKLAEVVQDGLEAKIRILEGEVLVNGELELRRGRKLYNSDLVTVDEQSYEVVAE